MSKPFHLSFVVPDLQLSEAFYIDVLNCKKGRDTGKWIDIIFFGHQLTLHQETDTLISRPIDHFGVILDKEEWSSISEKMVDNDIAFILPPTQKPIKDGTESGKFIVKDPAGNLLEFKFQQTKLNLN